MTHKTHLFLVDVLYGYHAQATLSVRPMPRVACLCFVSVWCWAMGDFWWVITHSMGTCPPILFLVGHHPLLWVRCSDFSNNISKYVVENILLRRSEREIRTARVRKYVWYGQVRNLSMWTFLED